MKRKLCVIIAALVISSGLARAVANDMTALEQTALNNTDYVVIQPAATNGMTALVQKGLFEEEANHNLEAAIRAYQTALDNYGKERALAATAVFRLGECYRKQGNTNDANAQYQRLLREFPEQTALAELSRGYVGGAAAHAAPPATRPGGDTSAEDEEIRKIKEMIQNSPDLINRQPDQGNATPLGQAARNDQLAVAQFLLTHGADIQRGGNRTPLGWAVAYGHNAMVELLLNNGAKVDAPDPGANTPLVIAVAKGFKVVAETLLAHGAGINVAGPNHVIALDEATGLGSVEMVNLLLAHHADVNARDAGGNTPLATAIMDNHMETAGALLTKGAEVDATNNEGLTPLYLASLHNEPDAVQLLIANKADVNAAANDGTTPLLVAIEKVKVDIALVKLLLENGANPAAQVRDTIMSSDNGRRQSVPRARALDLAILHGRADLVDLLLTWHADANARWEGETPLLHAIERKGREDMMENLLEHGADPNLTDEAGRSPLMFAVEMNNVKMVQDLIAHHADVNAVDNQGDPPLAYVGRTSRGGGGGGRQLRNLPGPIIPPPPSRFGNPYSYQISAGLGGDPGEEAARTEIKALLLKAGANEDYQRLNGIFLSRKGSGSLGQKVLDKGTNSVNHYSLCELLAAVYHTSADMKTYPGGPIPFPDLAHIVINRLKADGGKEEIAVNLEEILEAGDCAKDPPLQWGDIVQVGESDHPVQEPYGGLSEKFKEVLRKCVSRNVEMIVKGRKTTVPLALVDLDGGQSGHLYPFYLYYAVHQANVLLISSDLTRVKVTRPNPGSPDHPQVMEFNLENPSDSDLFLRDGDVIEIPERAEK